VVWVHTGGLVLGRVLLGGRAIRPEIERDRFRVLTVGRAETLEIYFRAPFSLLKGTFQGKNGVLLPPWFPYPEGLAFYDIRLSLPRALRAVTAAEKIESRVRKGRRFYRFVLEHPVTVAPLLFGRYEYYYRKWGRGVVSLYLLSPDPDLAHTYLDRALEVLSRYQELLGPYPYGRLSIAEVPEEVGEAYPTMILLGSRVLRLPFIPRISLPHEILHQWFGCGVFPARANWSEGLVTYLADWREEEREGRGLEYRKDLQLSHESWCRGRDPFPLAEFQERRDRCTQALGYGKGAYVFYMLEQKMGKKAFHGALQELAQTRVFQEVSWRDLAALFSRWAGKDLSGFFEEWVFRKGKPRLGITRNFLLEKKNGYHLGLTLYQEPPFYHLRVPLVVRGKDWQRTFYVELSGPQKVFDLTLEHRPEEVLVDPEYRLWRKLADYEIPPLLGFLWSYPGRVYLYREDWPLYQPFVHFLRRLGYVVSPRKDTRVPLDAENIVLLGLKPAGLAFVLPKKTPTQGLYLRALKNPARPGRILVWVKASNREEVRTLVSKLKHYWRSDSLFLRDRRVVEHHLSRAQQGLHLYLRSEVSGLPVKDLLPFEDILRRVALYRVILVGEEHDRYEHHLTQLRLLRALVKSGHRVALGLEMFEWPFQQALDDFVAGRIDEKALLERTEYFKRWRFDWKLYRPILLYARKKGLPVVALNAPSELVKKVSREGLSHLSPEEKAELPQMDLHQEAYRAFLWKIYKKHRERMRDFPDFENFYQVQILWDETMAERAWKWLKAHPDYQMVILCGKGHVAFGYGIPSRLRRRGISSVTSIVLASQDQLRPGYADFILYPESVPAPFTARLGVWLKETPKGLKVVQVKKGSAADKAGIRSGDYLLAADGKRLSSVADLRLLLTFKRKGDSLLLTLKRGSRRLKLKVTF